MLSSNVSSFTAADAAPPRWVSPALTGATMLLWIGGIVLQHVLKPWPSQDDAAQHIVWFRQFMPGAPMPASEIGDYFLSSNGAAFVALYRGIATIGIDPIAAAWVVGLASALAAALACSGIVSALGGSRWAAAAASPLMLIYLQGFDDIHSGSARAIGWAVLGLALWMLVRARPLGFALILSAGAFVYPTTVAIALLAAALWRAALLLSGRDWRSVRSWLAAGLVPAAILAATLATHDPWGPTVSLAEAVRLPDFQATGRTPLFGLGSLDFWLLNNRLGLLPDKVRTLALMHVAAIAAAASGLLPAAARRFLLLLVGAATLLWLAAELSLFALYLPARYPTYGIAFASVIAASFLWGRWLCLGQWLRAVAGALLLIGSIAVIGGDWPDACLKGLHSPRLVDAVRRAPAGKIAGLSSDVDRMPILAWRDVYWGREFSQAYKTRYRRMMHARSVALVNAITADDARSAASFVAASGTGAIMLPDDLFAPGDQNWARGLYPAERAKLAAPGAAERSWLWNQRQCMTRGERDRLFDGPCLVRAAGTAR